jgi:hypothetical protein
MVEQSLAGSVADGAPVSPPAGSAGVDPDRTSRSRIADPDASFREATGERRVQSLPLSHMSIEVGHLYRDDLASGPDRLRDHFGQVAALSSKRPRISTCLLIDDYSAQLSAPAEVVPEVLRAARECGLEIDYLAREAACAEAHGAPLARLAEDLIVADPPPGTNGSRPPVTETGWLCNGQRSPATVPAATAAMEPAASWRPPVQNATSRHSVFVDVELWDERSGTRVWSCAFLAAVWQLLRLGLLRCHGAPVAVPQPWPEELPEVWERMSAVVQVNPRAAPFSAYRTFSILSLGFFATEHAVRTILSQVAVDPTLLAEITDRAAAERIRLPAEPVDRITYVFTG